MKAIMNVGIIFPQSPTSTWGRGKGHSTYHVVYNVNAQKAINESLAYNIITLLFGTTYKMYICDGHCYIVEVIKVV